MQVVQQRSILCLFVAFIFEPYSHLISSVYFIMYRNRFFTRFIFYLSPFCFAREFPNYFYQSKIHAKLEHIHSTTYVSLIGIEIILWLFSFKNKSERNCVKLCMPTLICTCCFHMYLFYIFTCALVFILQNLYDIQDDAKLLLLGCYSNDIHIKTICCGVSKLLKPA